MSGSDGAAEGLRRAKDVLFENGWNQHSAWDADGTRCLLGAVMASRTSLGWGDMFSALNEAVTGSYAPLLVFVTRWNDADGRQFDEVIELLDRAAKIAEAHEEAL